MNPGGTVYFPGGAPIAAGSARPPPGPRGQRSRRVGSTRARVPRRPGRGGDRRHGPMHGRRARRAATSRARDGRNGSRAPIATTPVAVRLGDPAADARAVVARRGSAQSWRQARVALYATCIAAIGRHARSALADPTGTSIVSAADADGNVVVVVHSNSFPRFGSGIVVPAFDLVLANRAGRGFTPEPGHPNFPTAGRRPATTLHAWAVAGIDGRAALHRRDAGRRQPDAVERPDASSGSRRASRSRRSRCLSRSGSGCPTTTACGSRPASTPRRGRVAACVAPAVRSMHHRWGCKSAQQVVRIPRRREPVGGRSRPADGQGSPSACELLLDTSTGVMLGCRVRQNPQQRQRRQRRQQPTVGRRPTTSPREADQRTCWRAPMPIWTDR